MTPDQRIDANLDAILTASGSGLRYYSNPLIVNKMRETMRRIMVESYIKGSNDRDDSLREYEERNETPPL